MFRLLLLISAGLMLTGCFATGSGKKINLINSDKEIKNIQESYIEFVKKSKSDVKRRTKLTHNTDIFDVFYKDPEDILSQIETVFADRELSITPNKEKNKLVIKSDQETLDAVEILLETLDTKTPQVQITATIIEANDGFTKSFNNNLTLYSKQQHVNGRDRVQFIGVNSDGKNSVEFEPSNSDKNGSSLIDHAYGLAGGALLLGNISSVGLKAVIDTSIVDTKSKEISSPQILVLNNESASIISGNKLHKVIPGSGDTAGSILEVNQNLSLNVKPTIFGDEEVNLKIVLTNDKPSGSDISDVSTQEQNLSSTISLISGQTAIIGGVKEQFDIKKSNKVPIIGSIPVLGSFFNQKSTNKGKTQLLIFITAKVI